MHNLAVFTMRPADACHHPDSDKPGAVANRTPPRETGRASRRPATPAPSSRRGPARAVEPPHQRWCTCGAMRSR
jgi:hypothetical protein